MRGRCPAEQLLREMGLAVDSEEKLRVASSGAGSDNWCATCSRADRGT
jgi:hypothetical protein